MGFIIIIIIIIIIILKSTFLFSPAPRVRIIHQVARAPSGSTDESRDVHLGFIPGTNQALKVITESFKSGHGLHSSERRMDCNLCHKQNATVVIPNGEKIKDVSEKLIVWQQIQH